MKFEASGLDGAISELEEAAAAMDAIDGDLAQVAFDTDDPASIQRAIIEMEAAVDKS